MMIRVKLVIMIRIAGARLSTVSRMMICIAAEKFSRLLTSGRRMVELDDVPPVSAPGAGASIVSGPEKPAGLSGIENSTSSGDFSWARAGAGTDKTITARQSDSSRLNGVDGLTRASLLIVQVFRSSGGHP